MRKIAITRTAFILTILVAVIYYSYEAFGPWVAVAGGVLWWLIWTMYCGWINKNQRSEVEKYIKDFSISEKSLHEYQYMTDFFLTKNSVTDKLQWMSWGCI